MSYIERFHRLGPQNSVWRILGQNQTLDVRNYNSYSLAPVSSLMIIIVTIFHMVGIISFVNMFYMDWFHLLSRIFFNFFFITSTNDLFFVCKKDIMIRNKLFKFSFKSKIIQ